MYIACKSVYYICCGICFSFACSWQYGNNTHFPGYIRCPVGLFYHDSITNFVRFRSTLYIHNIYVYNLCIPLILEYVAFAWCFWAMFHRIMYNWIYIRVYTCVPVRVNIYTHILVNIVCRYFVSYKGLIDNVGKK